MRVPIVILLLGCSNGLLPAAPFLHYRRIFNAASRVAQDLPNGSIARGSIFTMLGTGLGPAGVEPQRAFPLTTTWGGVSIEVRQGTIRVAAIPILVSPTQIDAIMPSNAPLGAVAVRVAYNGESSNYSTATVVPASFGAFSVNKQGIGPGVIQNVIPDSDPAPNSSTNPAARGQSVMLSGTGLGAVADDTAALDPADLPVNAEVFVGGKSATVSYKGRDNCCGGQDRIVFTVPDDAPFGCNVPVQVRVNGSIPSNAVTMAISDAETQCSDVAQPIIPPEGNTGLVILARSNAENSIDFDLPLNSVSDLFMATFLRGESLRASFDPFPPAGTCTVYSDMLGPAGLLGFVAGLLDAGPSIQVQRTTVARNSVLAVYTASLGSTVDVTPPSTLNTGNNVTITAGGGADVGGFSVTVAAPPPFDFKERAGLAVVDRSAALPLSWSGVPGTVLIFAYNRRLNADSGFVCTAPAVDGSFRVPAYVLQALPPSRLQFGQSDGFLGVALVPPPSNFTAPSVDAGYLFTVSATRKAVLFQ